MTAQKHKKQTHPIPTICCKYRYGSTLFAEGCLSQYLVFNKWLPRNIFSFNDLSRPFNLTIALIFQSDLFFQAKHFYIIFLSKVSVIYFSHIITLLTYKCMSSSALEPVL